MSGYEPYDIQTGLAIPARSTTEKNGRGGEVKAEAPGSGYTREMEPGLTRRVGDAGRAAGSCT